MNKISLIKLVLRKKISSEGTKSKFKFNIHIHIFIDIEL